LSVENIRDIENGIFIKLLLLGAGTIYQSLGKLENDGLIIQVKEIDRKKFNLVFLSPCFIGMLITEIMD
jgi:DNA-binding PadR family transcriptional regulator